MRIYFVRFLQNIKRLLIKLFRDLPDDQSAPPLNVCLSAFDVNPCFSFETAVLVNPSGTKLPALKRNRASLFKAETSSGGRNPGTTATPPVALQKYETYDVMIGSNSKKTLYLHFLNIFFLHCILKISNYNMKISSKCNVEKDFCFVLTKKLSFCNKNKGSQIKFCAI